MPENVVVECDYPGCGWVGAGPESGKGNAYWRLSAHQRKHAREEDGNDRPVSPPPEPPRTVVDVNLGMDKRRKPDPAVEAVRQRAIQAAGAATVVLVMLGQPADAVDIERGKVEWAGAVADVSVHEEWLRKLCAGGEGSERVMAWVKLGAATLGMLLPILLRHEVLPESIARVFAAAQGQVDMGPVPDAPADTPDLSAVPA